MVELRKRKEAPPPPPPAKKRAPSKAKKDAPSEAKKDAPSTAKKDAPKVDKSAEAAKAPEVAVEDAPAAAAAAPAEDVPAATKAGGPPKAGDSIELSGFGGEVQTHSEEATTLEKLLEASTSGVVLFTYPKASTPGCTTQVCLFRDAYDDLTKAGLSVYGLSNDAPKANKNFVEKQKLQYPLLCDRKQTLISAIGLKKAPKGTARGVFVVDKSGKVLASEPGGPAATLEVVKKVVAGFGGDADSEAIKKAENGAAADTAAEVADTAEKLDG